MGDVSAQMVIVRPALTVVVPWLSAV